MLNSRPFTGEMCSHALQADKSVIHELCRGGWSGVCQRTPMVTKVLVTNPTVCALAAVCHILWNVQRVHCDHRLLLWTAVYTSHGSRAEPPVLYFDTAHTSYTAQLRAQSQVLGARVYGGQPVDGRWTRYHILLHAVWCTQHFKKASCRDTWNVPNILLSHRVCHGSYWSGMLYILLKS